MPPSYVDDVVNETFVIVVHALGLSQFTPSARFKEFVRSAVGTPHVESIDEGTIRQRAELIKQVLGSLSERDREILTRFYILEQGQEEICSEMALTEVQFRLLQSRAKARFGELGKKKVRSRSLSAAKARASSSSDVERILPAVAHAVAVFGDEGKASHWMATPLPILGDRSPSQLLESADGVELVEQVLTRIEHNIPS